MSDSDVMLAKMRCGVLRLKLMQAEIEEAAVLLRDARISAFGAIGMLREAGLEEVCDMPAAGSAAASFALIEEGAAA